MLLELGTGVVQVMEEVGDDGTRTMRRRIRIDGAEGATRNAFWEEEKG